MCIRDRKEVEALIKITPENMRLFAYRGQLKFFKKEYPLACLLYTSDAADERSSVDLGGRRIIKKKNHKNLLRTKSINT